MKSLSRVLQSGILAVSLIGSYALAATAGAPAQATAIVAQSTDDATSGSPSTESQGQTQQSQGGVFSDESDNGPEFGYGE